MSDKRKRLLINPKFQKSFILYTFAITTAIITIFFLANLYFYQKYVNIGKNVGLSEDHIYFNLLKEQRNSLNFIFAITAIIVLIITGRYGLHLSNKIAGPIYRMQNYLKSERASPSPPALKFRKGDYFEDLAEDFNGFVSAKQNRSE